MHNTEFEEHDGSAAIVVANKVESIAKQNVFEQLTYKREEETFAWQMCGP